MLTKTLILSENSLASLDILPWAQSYFDLRVNNINYHCQVTSVKDLGKNKFGRKLYSITFDIRYRETIKE